MKSRKFVFYLLSFLEGASVMAAELLGAKMLSPFFGSSIYVWSSVLSFTLGGLALGYFAGGLLSGKKNMERNLYYILLASALFLVLMPAAAKEVMVHTGGLSLQPSVLLSSFIILFPPVFCMGMVSPLIVECISSLPADEKAPGKTAGTVYAISTTGGIISTLLMGFYFIPGFGLTLPSVVMGAVLGLVPAFFLISGKRYVPFIFLAVVLNSLYGAIKGSPAPDANGMKLLYSSEGLLGQVLVADYCSTLEKDHMARPATDRILFVNRSTQTVVTRVGEERIFFEYVDLIAASASGVMAPGGSQPRALVLGLGGGSVANALLKKGFAVKAVELDPRMAEVAQEFFELDAKADVLIDDARHFVKQEMQKQGDTYDVIVLDAFIGEVNPHHLFTHEFFSEVQALLSDHGRFFINGNGFWENEAGLGMRSVCKTLLAAGFGVTAVPTKEAEAYRNLLLIAERSAAPSLASGLPGISAFSLGDAFVLEDERPRLDLLNAAANKRWREACMNYFLNGYYSGRDRILFR